jgi:hypothetical protein
VCHPVDGSVLASTDKQTDGHRRGQVKRAMAKALKAMGKSVPPVLDS